MAIGARASGRVTYKAGRDEIGETTLSPGEILEIEYHIPSWTPNFFIASASWLHDKFSRSKDIEVIYVSEAVIIEKAGTRFKKIIVQLRLKEEALSKSGAIPVYAGYAIIGIIGIAGSWVALQFVAEVRKISESGGLFRYIPWVVVGVIANYFYRIYTNERGR